MPLKCQITQSLSSFAIKQYINYNSENIYLITSIQCRTQYIGHTSQNLKCRIGKHISDIPHVLSQNVSSVSQHFASVHSGSTESLIVQGIERVYPPLRGGDCKRNLLNRETMWMFQLQTVFPKGLNCRQELILHYQIVLCILSIVYVN